MPGKIEVNQKKGVSNIKRSAITKALESDITAPQISLSDDRESSGQKKIRTAINRIINVIIQHFSLTIEMLRILPPSNSNEKQGKDVRF